MTIEGHLAPIFIPELLCIRAPQFKKVSLGNEVGSKTDQNKPFRLGLRSFASKLMDLDGLKVSNFQPKI